MLLQAAAAILLQGFGIAYSWLNQNLVSPILAFTRGFEFAIVFSAMALFLVISVFLLIRHAKKLPKYYVIEILDIYGKKVSIDGVRQVYSTHAAAESYARSYRESFGEQYRFRVVGIPQEIPESPA
ncbi:MAG: hypothetical protein MN733_14005 [Nitrososphaera sp.]|nr:hypothetical protein [Nitrososphaera sp.]